MHKIMVKTLVYEDEGCKKQSCEFYTARYVDVQKTYFDDGSEVEVKFGESEGNVKTLFYNGDDAVVYVDDTLCAWPGDLKNKARERKDWKWWASR